MKHTFGNWAGKKVFVTGHTGFKGGWLVRVLTELKKIDGEQNPSESICGYSLVPDTIPSFFESQGVENLCAGHFADIRDGTKLKAVMSSFEPDIVFHLAAQPLVRRSYRDPVETFSTNVMGTVNLLEAVRECASRSKKPQAVVVVTTDKVYENLEQTVGYPEDARLGGHDPYSNSKACSELVVSCYRNSFLNSLTVPIVTARAGNVVGGGDWSEDRLIPDFIRAATSNQSLELRNPKAIRPWQHVLEPIFAYIQLAYAIQKGESNFLAYNFGPDEKDARSVEEVINLCIKEWGSNARWHLSAGAHPHETHMLSLNNERAKLDLNVSGQLSWSECVHWTMDWYKKYYEHPKEIEAYTKMQIHQYLENLNSRRVVS